MKRSLFLFLFSLYLLSYAPVFHSSDGLAMFATAENLARRGAWDIEQLHWMGLQQGTFGLDGLLYSRKGAGQPILALPLTWLGLVLPGFGTATATLLFGALLTALTAVLIADFLARLGYRPRTVLTAALIFGTGTMAWAYAKTFFSDTLAGSLLLLTLWALLRLRLSGQARFAFLAGLSLAWAVATRYAEGVFLAVFGIEFLVSMFQVSAFKLRITNYELRNALAFAAPIAAIGSALIAFNISRYGSALSTGYLPQETFSAIWWQGIFGQLLSPGRGLLLYNPILILAFFGLIKFWRAQKIAFWSILSVIVIHLLLYGKWFMWHGGFAWGARFMVATLPFWAILMAPVLENLSRPKQWLIGILWAISTAMQIPGVAVDFDLWQNKLLETGLPLFAPETFFNPKFSPLLQTWQFIRVPNLDVAWVVGGAIQWGLLSILTINLAVAGIALWGRKTWWRRASTGLAVLSAIFLLWHAHRAQPETLRAAFSIINQFDAPIIYQNPESATAISELYAGRKSVLGLGSFDADVLSRQTENTSAVWWIPPYQNDTESALMADFGVAQSLTFDEQRVVLFARPDGDSQTLAVSFGDGIALESVELSSALKSKSPFAVTFNWRTENTPSADYQIFIHLRNSAGETVAQSDGQPVNWMRPTSTWTAGESITDRHALWIPALSAGEYSLVAGLYAPKTGERLTTALGADTVSLGTFKINR